MENCVLEWTTLDYPNTQINKRLKLLIIEIKPTLGQGRTWHFQERLYSETLLSNLLCRNKKANTGYEVYLEYVLYNKHSVTERKLCCISCNKIGVKDKWFIKERAGPATGSSFERTMREVWFTTNCRIEKKIYTNPKVDQKNTTETNVAYKAKWNWTQNHVTCF